MTFRTLFWKNKLYKGYMACNDLNIYHKGEALPQFLNENNLECVQIDGEEIIVEIAVRITFNRKLPWANI